MAARKAFNRPVVMAGFFLLNKKAEVLLLFRAKWQHWETPGGKLEQGEALNPVRPTQAELGQIARRELSEEVVGIERISKPWYFGWCTFIIPDGRRAVVHKFAAYLLAGTPEVGEPEVFSACQWLPVKELQNYPLSPDLKKLLPKIQEKLK